MIRFPYGIADFQSIRREGMFYLDRTAGLELRQRYADLCLGWVWSGSWGRRCPLRNR